jgi:hypothetical protein
MAISKIKGGNQPKSKVAISRIEWWQSAELNGGNQPNQNCDKNSIVAVTPEMNTNSWRILP